MTAARRMRSRVCLTPSGSVGLPTGRYTGLPRAGKPTDDAFIEAFNGRFRAECLNAHWFPSLCGRPGTDGGRRKYYEERPHRSIGQKPPAMPLTHVGAPARRRDKPENSSLSAIQRWVSLHNSRGSHRRWMKVQWHGGQERIIPRAHNSMSYRRRRD
jgi:hypothetical protein